MITAERLKAFAQRVSRARKDGYYPYFCPLMESFGPIVKIGSKEVIMAGSNDYLGLSHDPRVIDASAKAMCKHGTGPGGSRFLNGNTALIDTLEERLASFLGKRRAIVHTTGFMTNHGVIGCMLEAGDHILCDRDVHASIIAGCQTSAARMSTYIHNEIGDASKKLEKILKARPNATVLIITDGVFSMSGDIANLPELARLRRTNPRAVLYLDDAHGLGVIGIGGRGTADHFGLTRDVDFLMGTFSKSFASIGGFVASDNEDLMLHLKHTSRTLMFSAALPAASAAAALAVLDILEKEPDRVARLHANVSHMREGYRRIGLKTADSQIPILPIRIGKDMAAYTFAAELLRNGVFAMPAVYPAVEPGCAIIRTAYMATHELQHMDRILEVLDKLVRKYRIREADQAA